MLVSTFCLTILGFVFAGRKKVMIFYISGVIAAFMEEILFRGVIFGISKTILENNMIAIFISAITFGVYHFKNLAESRDLKWAVTQFIYTGLVYGPIFGYLRITNGDIYLAVFSHFIINSYVCLAPKQLEFSIIKYKNFQKSISDEFNQ